MEQSIVLLAGVLVIGAALGYALRYLTAAQRAKSVEAQLKQKIEEANIQAKDVLVEAKARAVAIGEDAQRDARERKIQLDKLEERIHKREESFDDGQRQLRDREQSLEKQRKEVEHLKLLADEVRERASREVERVAGMSVDEAKAQLLSSAKEDYRRELAAELQKLERERLEEVEKKSLDIITTALHRYARGHVAELTTTVFTLSNEDMKGKIIGREGRNIRSLERLTGVEIIVDETPDTIVFSSFDPLRREIARVALEKLIKDGRIQPAKIEEKVKEAENELSKRMFSLGEEAATEVGVYDLPKEIVQLLGRLHFRTSYGQNVLIHSVEMAHIAAIIAAEVGANVEVAKKGALLHDIGKAISHEVEGTHVELGRKLLKKYGVDELVIKAMESHHEEYPFSTPESYIVTAADALSAARPGARRDTVENYLKRLADLEKVVHEFEGVQNAYALSAGREIRVFVVPEKIDDFGALQLAKNIATKIQTELKYPGEIKVNVIREVRAVEYAR